MVSNSISMGWLERSEAEVVVVVVERTDMTRRKPSSTSRSWRESRSFLS